MDPKRQVEIRLDKNHSILTNVYFALIAVVIVTGFVFKYLYSYTILRYIVTAGAGLVALWAYQLNSIRKQLERRQLRLYIYFGKDS